MGSDQCAETWRRHPFIGRALEELGVEMRLAAATGEAELQSAAQQLVARPGKYLRPILALLIRGDRPLDDTTRRALAAVEIIHLASLYHDDIMDRATVRRGEPSVNDRYGNRQAALAGTFLMTRAGALLSTVGEPALGWGARAARRLCRGQLAETENAFNLELSVSEHLQIITDKTAALFELAGRLGAWLGRCDATAVEQISDSCGNLGMAFQLFDDVLDLSSDVSALGKPGAADLRSGVYSYAVLSALSEKEGQLRRVGEILSKRRLSEADLDEALALVRGSGGIDRARDRAHSFARKAEQGFRSISGLTYCDDLESLARFAVDRAA